jgi:hypothetical protein
MMAMHLPRQVGFIRQLFVRSVRTNFGPPSRLPDIFQLLILAVTVNVKVGLWFLISNFRRVLNVAYALFWAIPQRLWLKCQRFGTLPHLHRPVGILAYEDGIDRVFRNVGI